MKNEYDEIKQLQLSEEARAALAKAQRFDRFIYAKET